MDEDAICHGMNVNTTPQPQHPSEYEVKYHAPTESDMLMREESVR
jgi:hypothetical protein